MYRIVLDTNVVVAGLRSRHGASNVLLRQVAQRDVTMLATVALFLEYEDVLNRPEQRLAHGLSPDDLLGALRGLADLIEGVDVHFRWRPQLRDASDELVLEAAVNGRADALVTHNLDDFSAVAPRFGLTVIQPREMIRRIQS